MEVRAAEIEGEGDLLVVCHRALTGKEKDEVFLYGRFDRNDVVGCGKSEIDAFNDCPEMAGNRCDVHDLRVMNITVLSAEFRVTSRSMIHPRCS